MGLDLLGDGAVNKAALLKQMMLLMVMSELA